MTDLDSKRNRIELVVKILALLLVSFLVAPVIFVAIKGLVGLVIAAAIAGTVIYFIPWFASVVANWRLKAIKYEASKNPIETLENDYNTRRQALQDFRDRIQATIGEVTSFKGKLEGFKQQFPADADKFDEQYKQARSLLELRKAKYEDGKVSLKRYEAEISRAKAFWELAQAAAAMNKSAGVDTEEFIAKIQRETALDSVQKSLGMAFADIELSLMDEKGAKVAAPIAQPAKTVTIPISHDSLDLNIEAEPHKAS